MTRANQWLVFSSALSVVAGFFSGIMFSRRSAGGPAEHTSAIGRFYEIAGETYVDGAVHDFLRARADAREQLGEWTLLRYRNLVVFIKLLHAMPVLPGQRGALYAIRQIRGDSANAVNDAQVQKLLQDLIDLALIAFAGRWRSWDEAATGVRGGRPSMIRTNEYGGLT
jgi:hypothetical protein